MIFEVRANGSNELLGVIKSESQRQPLTFHIWAAGSMKLLFSDLEKKVQKEQVCDGWDQKFTFGHDECEVPIR